MRILWRVRISLLWSVIAVAGAAAPSCSEHDPDPYQPLTEACDECLLAPGLEGCGDTYDVCEELDQCESIVLCELGQQCYTEPSTSDCSEVRGCESGADAAELDAAAEFEACARSVCVEVCSFEE